MKITKIEVQKKNKERVSIFIDEEFAFGVSVELVYSLGLKKGLEVDQEYIDKVIKEEERKRAFSDALNYLSYRIRSEKEIRDKLKEKEYDEETIIQTINRLEIMGHINDELFAKTFISDKINLDKRGISRIRMELLQKGISKEIIENIFQEEDHEETEYDNALKLAVKKLNSYKDDMSYKKFQKLYGFLMQKGFSKNTISKVMSELKERTKTDYYDSTADMDN